MGKLIRLAAFFAFLKHHIHDLRDDIARALHDHAIANADIAPLPDRLALLTYALDIVLIVQRRVGHNHTADGDWLQPRHRRQRASAAHLNIDAAQNGERLFRREFMRNRPARAARAKTKPGLQVEPVHLVNNTVDIVIQRGTLHADGAIMRKQPIHAVEPLHQRIDRKAPLAKNLDHAQLRIRRHVRHFPPGIGEEPELAACRHLRIKLAQRTCCRIARVHIGLLALRRHLRIERQKVALGHIDLAAHFHDSRRTCRKPVRDFSNGADIGCYILARCAIPACRTANQNSILVTDRHGKPIDLRFCGKGDGIIRQLAQKAIDAANKITHVLITKGIIQRQHGPRVNNRRKGGKRRGCTHTPRRAVIADKCRKVRFNRLVAPLQCIISRIGNFRPVLGVIKLVVMSNRARQPFQFGGSFEFGQFLDGNIGHLEHFQQKCETVLRRAVPAIPLKQELL